MNDSQTSPSARWSLMIHGGAGSMTRATITGEQEALFHGALATALARGTAILANRGSSIDAVEAAVRVLEDDPLFNAGRGAVLTYDRQIYHDAAIMDGADRRAGAVAQLRGVINPVSAARAVMEHSPHVMLSGEGAAEFAAEQALATAPQSYFETHERRRQLDELKADSAHWFDVDVKYGTVGAVACDGQGHVAAATSTGGLTGKRWGRIGDTPLIGAGTYADDRAAAVSATGAGEFFIRAGAAHEICALIRLTGQSAAQAAELVLGEIGVMGGRGGVIIATPDGHCTWHFTTPGMYRAKQTSHSDPVIAIYGD